MLLSALLQALPEARMHGEDVEIDDITYDSRLVHPGALFLAVPTVNGPDDSGGFLVVADAVSSGAVAVVAQRPLRIDGITTVIVPDARRAMADIAAQFFGNPGRELAVFGVTGTDGKTTTTYLLNSILTRAGAVTGLIGTVETRIAGQRLDNIDRMTTPEAPDIQRLLRRMVDAGVTHVSLEASSHALALDRLRGVPFAATALTNITGDHVEFHGSFDAYVAAKLRLFSELASTCPAVVNRDDPHFGLIASRHPGPVLSYGFTPQASYRIHLRTSDWDGSTFDLVSNDQHLALSLPLPGRFNVSNATAASLLATTAGVDWHTVARGLATAEQPPGRLQQLTDGAPFRIVIDYAHTPNAFRSLLTELRERTPGRLIAVFGATGNRDRAKRPILGATAGELADFFIITNEDPFSEDPDQIINEVASGAPLGVEGAQFVRIHDRGDAIQCAIDRAMPGDTVVITGKGHEHTIVSGGRKQPWNDADAVRAIMANRR
jgi:UDP-N-acetylmuramoyl-L-alanyl-D-glutamate--2,6-diaminopimelate ligase